MQASWTNSDTAMAKDIVSTYPLRLLLLLHHVCGTGVDSLLVVAALAESEGVLSTLTRIRLVVETLERTAM